MKHIVTVIFAADDQSCLGVLVLMYFLSRFLIGKAVEPVEDTMKSQKEFIASASHELKAPLAVIQANAETMESGQKQKIILDECSRMSKLVQSMLALASSDAGNWKMDIRETDVDCSCENCFHNL